MDILLNMTNIVSNIAIFLTCGFTIWQLLLMKKNFKADHERRRKQATIEFYHIINKEFTKLLVPINEKFSTDGIINVCDVKNDNTLLDKIYEFLSHMERLAVGVNTRIYDITVLDRMVGSFIIKWHDRLIDIIKWRRDVRKENNLHSDFVRLVSEIIELRKKRFPKQEEKDLAKIEYS